MAESHGGAVTLLWTNVVGSSALKQHLGDKSGLKLVYRHHKLRRIEQFRLACRGGYCPYPTPGIGKPAQQAFALTDLPAMMDN